MSTLTSTDHSPHASAADGAGTLAFSLDGQQVSARAGESIWHAAQRLGVQIPHLCHRDGLRPEGNCRACVVELAGERTLAASCCRAVEPGMQVASAASSERVRHSQALVLQLLLADLPDAPDPPKPSTTQASAGETSAAPHGELSDWAQRLGVAPHPVLQRLRRPALAPDDSHPAIAVNLNACIQCGRCVRACREEQVNGVLGLAERGAATRVVFDLDAALGASTCVACGECVQACPTGALSARSMSSDCVPPPTQRSAQQTTTRDVDSVCPYCGVGCLLTYHVQGEKIVSVSGRNGPANQGRLCVKGRFGLDYVHHAQRLTQPLVRRPGVPKQADAACDPTRWHEVFEPVSWPQALERAAQGLLTLRQAHGPRALAGLGSAKGSNEEAYLFQKLVRTGLGSNNVDHCTRLCHASSVYALLEGLGSGAVSNPVRDVARADVILVIGANPTSNHPVAATWIKNAAQRGARVVLIDPRSTDLSAHAWRSLRFTPGSDVALLNALIHTIIFEGLVAHDFVAQRTRNFEALREQVRACSPEAMAPLCGIAPERLREVARAYAQAPAAMILWGMGVSQHSHGTDNARCLIALCAVAGQIGKPGSGLHPLRGQNNVQGASDAGLIPMMLPNYQRVSEPQVRAWFEDFWRLGSASLDATPGLTVVEIMNQALAPASDPRKVRGLYIMGENPAMSDPDLNHARQALASLEHLVVQDIFMTETAWLADVVLPASAWPEKVGTATNTDRLVQLGRAALAPPGQARRDMWIIQQMAAYLGLRWHYPGEDDGVAAVYEEMRQAMHSALGGISWQRLQREGSVTSPCTQPDEPDQAVLFTQRFATPDGLLHLVPAAWQAEAEPPDAQYPLVLITGRILEHWHTGSMTRRSAVLDELAPHPVAHLSREQMQRLGCTDGQVLRLRSRRGQVQVQVQTAKAMPDGAVFLPFAYHEAAANLLTHAALDPQAKIPPFKYCAVRLELL